MSGHKRPILMSGQMVWAVISGRKTETRRVIKPQPEGQLELINFRGAHNWHDPGLRQDEYPWGMYGGCPYGQVGDLLWVREAWRVGTWNENEGAIAVDYRADGYKRREWLSVPNEDDFVRYWQQSTDDAIAAGLQSDESGYMPWPNGDSPCRWRPGIFMPRWASRLTLRITWLGNEQLSDITEGDARAEGFENVVEFLTYWDRLNAKRGYSSEVNPWVWIVRFVVACGGEERRL